MRYSTAHLGFDKACSGNLQVVERVRRKAAIFGQDITDSNDGQGSTFKVEPSTVAQLYEKWIMPLTKQVQVAYLLRRLD